MAHFFAGDAFARHTNWPAALAEFKMAISLDPNATLAYNARAVVHAKLNEEDLAEQDFTEAIRTSNYGLADAYCGMGFLWIQRKDGPDGALDCFQKALDINIKFALAWHGKACIELTQRDAQNATNSIENSLKCTRSNPKDPASIDWKIARRMIANVDAFCLKQQGRTNDVLLADAFDPGSSFTEMENSQDQMQKINDMKEQVQNTISSSAATIADMKDRLNNNLGNSFPQPGGVLAGITVMNGNWPFRPLYGTAYGLR